MPLRLSALLALLLPLGAATQPSDEAPLNATEAIDAAADERDPILYVMEDEDSRVYLLGSIHLLDASAYPLPADVEAAYEDADALAFEIDLTDIASIQTAVLTRAQYTDGRTLADAMGEDFSKLEARVGPAAAQLNGFEPWAVQLTLTPMIVQGAGYNAENGVDMHFLSRAQTDEKELLALETADSQMAIFDEMAETDQVAMLVELLDEWDELPAQFESMVTAWETGDEEALETLLNDVPESVRPALLRDRNAAWVPQIEGYLAREGEDVLVVVGAGHLAGEDSVVAMLREKGYTLTRQ
ncbi:MAG: TraB/GumN family protein [Bacteroidota bacterium]